MKFSGYFEIVGEIKEVEIIAVRGSIKNIIRLQKRYGIGRWRKLKGIARIRLESGKICNAEIHWYEAHGIGRKKLKIKRILD